MYCVATYARVVESLLVWLREVANVYLGTHHGLPSGLVDESLRCIRLINADMKTSHGDAGTYARNLFLDPEARGREADVLVCTYAV